jgi:hypothetical protein
VKITVLVGTVLISVGIGFLFLPPEYAFDEGHVRADILTVSRVSLVFLTRQVYFSSHAQRSLVLTGVFQKRTRIDRLLELRCPCVIACGWTRIASYGYDGKRRILSNQKSH